jgi:hypothetical protein
VGGIHLECLIDMLMIRYFEDELWIVEEEGEEEEESFPTDKIK